MSIVFVIPAEAGIQDDKIIKDIWIPDPSKRMAGKQVRNDRNDTRSFATSQFIHDECIGTILV